MCRSASRATVRSASANTREERKGLKPCFVLASTGARAAPPRAASRTGRPSRACAAAAGAAAGGSPSRRCPTPSGHGGPLSSARSFNDAIGPVLYRVVPFDAAAQLPPEGGAVGGGELANAGGQLLGILAREPEPRREEAVQCRVRREHRQARRSRLVHDLVRRAG